MDLSGYELPVQVVVVSDSIYVVRSASMHLSRWVYSGWITTLGAPVANAELWKRLHAAVSDPRLEVRFRWIKSHTEGHSDDVVFNDRCDALAKDHLYERFLRGTEWAQKNEDSRPPDKNMREHMKKKSGKRHDPYVNKTGKGTGPLGRR